MYNTKHRKKTIGLDFDDTVTLNPAMFKEMIEVFKRHDFEVYIVTARSQNQWCALLREFAELVENVIFTDCRAKCDIVEIDIWIDDFPLAITHDFKGARWQPSENTKKTLL